MSSLLNKFKKLESKTFGGEVDFFAPAVNNNITIRLEGVIMNMVYSPSRYMGWGIFKVKSPKEAILVRDASMEEKQRYLNLYPRFTAVVYKQDKMPHAVVSSLNINGNIRILLPENISIFDTVIVRWDGKNFWYDKHDDNANIINAERLKPLINEKVKPELVKIPGLTPSEMKAYGLAYENVRDKTKDIINKALTKGGGKLTNYIDRGDSYSVTYSVNGQSVTTTVDNKLRVQSAGICLSGGDKYFDLESLVYVIKEGQDNNVIVSGDYSNNYRGNRYYDRYNR